MADAPVQKTGGYLTYSPDSLGTLFLHWSETEIPDALAYFEAGKKIPPFKFKTNHGKTILTKGVDDKAKFYQGWGAYLKEALCRYNANCFQVFGKQAAREEILVALLQKGDHKVLRVGANNAQGEQASWSGDAQELAGFAVVNESNMSFKVGTLEQSVFMSKGTTEGYGFDMSSASVVAKEIRATTVAPMTVVPVAAAAAAGSDNAANADGGGGSKDGGSATAKSSVVSQEQAAVDINRVSSA